MSAFSAGNLVTGTESDNAIERESRERPVPPIHAAFLGTAVPIGALSLLSMAVVFPERRPDYLAIFPRRHACFPPSEFPTLLEIEVPGNVTLGEGTIVLHATPWTRQPLRSSPSG